MRLVTSLALTGCLVAALSACTTPDRPNPAAPPAASAPTSAQPASTARAGTKPAGTMPARTKPARTGPAAKPVAARPSWKSVDLAVAAYPDLGRCTHSPDLPDTAEIGDVRYADVTGDGVTDAVVAAACRTTTSGNPVRVLVYDGTDRRAPLRRLLTIGADQYLKTADVTTKGRTVTVASAALSDDAPRCCPDLRITQTYEWTGAEFRPVAIDTVKIAQD